MHDTADMFQQTLEQFLAGLSGKNRSNLTIRCYRIDVSQFLCWMTENDLLVAHLSDITKSHLSEYLATLSDHGLSGRTRARKLAAIKEYFRFLVGSGAVATSPAETMSAPKRERNGRTYLTPEEYTRLLSLAGSNPRDYAILQVFLQTGIRISELCSLTLSDVDLADHTLTIRQGKGMTNRSIELEKKGYQAIKNYLRSRPQSLSNALFLNYQAEPLSERGVQKLLAKYVKLSGITKKISLTVSGIPLPLIRQNAGCRRISSNSGSDTATSTPPRSMCTLASRMLGTPWSLRAHEQSISLYGTTTSTQTTERQAR
jgi:integrase/recombinase XerC